MMNRSFLINSPLSVLIRLLAGLMATAFPVVAADPPVLNTVEITLPLKDSKVDIPAVWGSPLRLQITSLSNLNGVKELRAEIHQQPVTAGLEPLAVSTAVPANGTSAVIDFSGKQMRLPMTAQSDGTLYLLLRVMKAEGVPSVYELGMLQLASSPPGDPASPPSDATMKSLAAKKTKFEAASLAVLKTLPTGGAAAGELAQVRGYYAESDGAEGDFSWAPDSTADEDGGMVIAPASGTGRWLRVAKPDRIKAAWYGAQAGTPTDQAASIQRAIDKVSSSGGGVVELDAGTFRIDATLRSRDNVIIEGKGRRTTILQQTPGKINAAILEFGDPTYPTSGIVHHNIGVRDVGFDLWNNRSGKGIRIRYPCHMMTVDNCDCWLSRVAAGETYHAAGDDHFIDMSVTAPGVNQLWIRGCRVTNCVQLTSNALAGIDGLYILNNWIEDPVAYGVAITGILQKPGFSIRNVFIQGNTFKNAGINVGRDQTSSAVKGNIEFYPVTHSFKNLVITDNHFIVGGAYSSSFSNAISICTYQTECSGVRIADNTVTLAEGTALQGQVGIQLAVYDYNWMAWKMENAAPLISTVNTASDTITSSKAHGLQDGMPVYFEPASFTEDALPKPLEAHRRYRAVRVDELNFKLTDFRTGRPIHLTGLHKGTVRFYFAPCVQDAEISGNIITGFSESIRINGAAGVGIRDNRCVGGSIYLSPGSVTEDITVRGNTVNQGFFSALGNVINGKLTDNDFDVRDDYFTTGNGVVVNFAPSQAYYSQDWFVERNKVDVIRLTGQDICRVAAGFAAGRGQGRVTVWNMEDNICADSVPKPFEEMQGPATMILAWGDGNKVRPVDPVFQATPPGMFSRFMAAARADSNMREQQSAVSGSGKTPLANALIMEGRNGSAQATATLTGVTFGEEGRAVSWRHRVGDRAAAAGLWALSGSSTAGHAPHALYAIEKDGMLTVRQMGEKPGTLDPDNGSVTGGDCRQVVADVTARRGLPTHFLVSISRTGALVLYVEGLPVAVTETVTGAAPPWNDASLPVDPKLNVGFVDISFPSFEGAFYSFDVLNFAPSDNQAQSIFSGGVAALAGFGLRSPAELVRNGSFTGAGGWTMGPDVAIADNAAAFTNAADGSGLNQTAGDYRKGCHYRLKFDVKSYISGLMYVGIGGDQILPPFAPAVGSYTYDVLPNESDGLITVRGAGGGTTLSLDNLSIVPLGAVASFVFDAGLGYQVEDKSGLGNHMLLATAGVGWLSPALSGRWTGRVTSDGFMGRNGAMMEPGHVITRISACSTSGGTFTLGEAPATAPASLVASTTLPGGVWTDLALLKRTSSSQSIWAALGTASDLRIIVHYEVPR